MNPDQMRLAAAFATGLAKLKAQEEKTLGCTLTAAEVTAMLWAIKQLRGGRDRGTTHQPAER